MKSINARYLIYRFNERNWVKLIANSGMFDREYYLRRYPDVVNNSIDPILHYVRYGASENRDPSASFSTAYYLKSNADVANSGLNPLYHYIKSGQFEGRLTTDLSSQIQYIVDSGLLDREFYLRNNPDVAASGLDPAMHYLSSGYLEGRNPSGLFDTNQYLAEHPEVAAQGINPLIDFLANGGLRGDLVRETRAQARLISTSGLMDPAFYLDRYPDVAAAGLDPAWHYVESGWREGRNPSEQFSTRRYQRRYLQDDDTINPLVHYLLIGRDQGHLITSSLSRSHESWSPTSQAEWAVLFERRLTKRRQALKKMNLGRVIAGSAPTFSIITTVYDTDREFLNQLAETIQAQAYPFFEWLILDNGSTAANTIEACREIAARDKRFRYFRVENNLHIIGGNKYIFDRVKGHYTIPVDSDDVLYPDSLALFANVVRDAGEQRPALIYSDEQKISEIGEPIEPIWRWDFAFSHALATAPAAHLMAYATTVGREVGVYTDDYAQGSHDWDTALRITENGARAVHVREVLYGWRVHAQSTASNSSAKTYISLSQFEVMEQSLSRRGLRDKFQVSSLFHGVVGYYDYQRKEICDQKINIDLLIEDIEDLPNLKRNLEMTAGTVEIRRIVYPTKLKAEIEPIIGEWKVVGRHYSSNDGLLRLLNEVSSNLFAKVVASSKAVIQSRRALWDAVGALELDLNAGVITGPVIDPEEVVLSLGLLAGLQGFVASPFYEWLKSEVPGHLWLVPRPVTAAPLFFVAIRAEVLRKGLRIKGIDRSDALYGLELGLDCASLGYGVINIPGMESVSDRGIPEMIGAGSSAKTQLRRKYRDVFAAGTIPTYLSDQANRFGMLRRPEEGAGASAIDYKLFAPAVPLSFRVDPDPLAQPTINVLLPAVRMISMSGGPNTALNLVYQLAKVGFAIRIISTDMPVDADHEPIWRHIQSISGISERLPNVEIVDGSDRRQKISIGANDVFFATAWWTAQMAKHSASLLDDRPFIYLIQDFEPILYPASSQYAQALETYALDHIPIVNTKLLRDFLVENRIGRHGNPEFAKNVTYFEPAISRDAFHPETHKSEKRRLLFYARPTTAQRNMFELGVAALQMAIAAGDLGAEAWEFIGMGEPFASVPLGHGATLHCAPWLGFDDYAKQMRQADVLLSLMMSPHPSYPPLEMAACGGMVVTNQYANKTPERMAEISANIIAAEPSVAGVAAAIAEAVERLEDVEDRQVAARVDFPYTWSEALGPVVKALSARLSDLGVKPNAFASSNEPRRLPLPDPKRGADGYAAYLRDAMTDRKQLYPASQEPGLLSFVSTVWNTPPAFLDVLARSMEAQEGGHGFEWYILDNGSTRPDVVAFLKDLGERPYVRLERVEENLGIIGGMRFCLERATGRYILPLDSDDYLTPDCVRIVTWHLQKRGYPALAYTDEDKLLGAALSGPYLKPDWDPVLFVNSCYIAHLCAIDREKALDLGAYTDGAAEGSHDWDTFTRFVLAGHTPHHIAEVVYSWRMHAQSTAGNINSKPVVFDSQRSVLTRFLNGQPDGPQFELVKNPMFGDTPDWWLRRRRGVRAPSLTTVIVSKDVNPRQPSLRLPAGIDHKAAHVALRDGAAALVDHALAAVDAGRLLHIISDEVSPDNDEWFHEAVGHFELFPDTVMVGGRTHSNGEVMTAGYFFGFGKGCDCPDRGRRLTDPGYAAQMWKQHSVSAVSALHAVVKPDFLLRALRETAAWTPSIEMLGAWLGASARKHGQRIVYSPFISGETKIDWDCMIGEDEQRRFVSYAMELIPERNLLSPDLGLTRETAYIPQRRPRSPALTPPDYTHWYLRQMEQRLKAIPAMKAKTRFSLLTPLYIGSDSALFRLTAESVLQQKGADFEWVILTQGPVTRDLRMHLKDLAQDSRVRLLTLKENLGIIGGMRHTLEAATGDYVISLDGDDLLEVDCLSLLAQAIESSAEPPAFLYTDEDIISGDTPQAPYLRPDWDPVLDLENSWIWHTCAYRRDHALKLGVYQFYGSEYCQDWDTLYRFTKAGFVPMHVPMITYHWRHHARSTSNSGDSNNGSSRSVQALLKAKIEDRGLEGVCEVARFPIDRGAEEWCIKRHARDLPTMHSVVLPASTGTAVPAIALLDLLKTVESANRDDLMILNSTAIQTPDQAQILEAVKIFEFQDEVVMVSGRLVTNTTVLAAGWMTDAAGRLHSPYDGLELTDAGPFVLGWKPQSISAGVIDLCVVKAGFLREALAAAPTGLAVEELGLWLGARAAQSGRRIAFSPLIEARVLGRTLHPTDSRTSQVVWDWMAGNHPTAEAAANRGAAAYCVKRFA